MPPRLRVVDVARFERPFRQRMPFRFGAATVTHGRQAILRARIRLEDGREADGFAAESLVPKWFDKDPALTDAQNQDQLRRALEIAEAAYLASGPTTAFGLFAASYREQRRACAAEGLGGLVASFGPALLDRAVLDALCRALGVGFYQAMRDNLPGLDPGGYGEDLAPDLAGFDLDRFLASLRPAASVHARHTVGLVDPIVAADQAPGTRVEDGLPETLQEVVAAYGHRFFKLKLGGEAGADLDRLGRIAAVLDGLPEYRVTLDGNEQFASAEETLALWEAVAAEPRLARLAAGTLFIEQPIRRAAALTRDVQALAAHRPVVVDESDDGLDAFPRAASLGYAGVSSKSCKGLYKSLLNRARCAAWAGTGRAECFMSAEDLTMLPGTAVQQDLALVALLGLPHGERNAHHFIDGFDERPEREAEAFLAAHPDLYHRQDGRVRLRIVEGRIALGSLDCPGYACAADPALEGMDRMPRAAWPC